MRVVVIRNDVVVLVNFEKKFIHRVAIDWEVFENLKISQLIELYLNIFKDILRELAEFFMGVDMMRKIYFD